MAGGEHRNIFDGPGDSFAPNVRFLAERVCLTR